MLTTRLDLARVERRAPSYVVRLVGFNKYVATGAFKEMRASAAEHGSVFGKWPVQPEAVAFRKGTANGMTLSSASKAPK